MAAVRSLEDGVHTVDLFPGTLDAEVRVFESSSDWPTREWSERSIINKCDQSEPVQSDTESKTLVCARGASRNSTPTPLPPHCLSAREQDTLRQHTIL